MNCELKIKLQHIGFEKKTKKKKTKATDPKWCRTRAVNSRTKAGEAAGTEWDRLKNGGVCGVGNRKRHSDECLMNGAGESSLMSPCSRCRHN